MNRRYDVLLKDHYASSQQMVFLSGPRQVGKTTQAKSCFEKGVYLTWDKESDKELFLSGADAVARVLKLDTPSEKTTGVIFDELHRYPKWKNFLKGFYDVYSEECKILVSGSARLDIFRKGADSLMGRYFLYRMHPLSLAEIGSSEVNLSCDIQEPAPVDGESMERFEKFGGFPDPFLAGNQRFYNRWKKMKNEQLFRGDVRDLSRIADLDGIQMLAKMVSWQAGQLMNYSTHAKQLTVQVNTVKAWLLTLESLYYSFRIRPWYNNVLNSLRKQPKVFLWDWSLVPDGGARRENLVASHLLKAVHWWTDSGLGEYDLFFLRDKAQREVDFLVTRNDKPWFMVEVKSSARQKISPALLHFQKQLRCDHVFQVVFDLPHAEMDCFHYKKPIKVPVSSLLAQLI